MYVAFEVAWWKYERKQIVTFKQTGEMISSCCLQGKTVRMQSVSMTNERNKGNGENTFRNWLVCCALYVYTFVFETAIITTEQKKGIRFCRTYGRFYRIFVIYFFLRFCYVVNWIFSSFETVDEVSSSVRVFRRYVFLLFFLSVLKEEKKKQWIIVKYKGVKTQE